jgi:DNA ligase (NAD+)
MGKLYNFIEVMKIKGIGPETIEDLYHAGIVHEIQDLFKLHKHFDEIISLEGYGPIAANNIIEAMESVKGTEAQVLGSLGISGVKAKKAQLLVDQLGMDRILQLEFQPHIIAEVSKVKGFGKLTAEKFVAGIVANKKLLKFLLRHIQISKTKAVNLKAVFTGFRNPDFENHLLKRGVVIENSITKETGLVIALNPTASSGKLKKAREAGIPIVSAAEAMTKFNFKQ